MIETITTRESERFTSSVATGSHVPRPENPVTNQALVQCEIYTNGGNRVDEEFIFKMTGIKQRYHTQELNSPPQDPNEIVPEMGYEALNKALKSKGWQFADLDYLLATTSFPLTEPLSEAIAGLFNQRGDADHRKTGLQDGYAACSGFAHWFHVINQHRDEFTGKRIAIVAAEQYSTRVDGFEKAIFGDGAGAIVFQLQDELEMLGSHSQHYPNLGGLIKMRVQAPPAGKNSKVAFFFPFETPEKGDLEMEGHQVFEFAIGKNNLSVAQNALTKARISWADVDHVVMHQANDRILKKIEEQLRKRGLNGPVHSNIAGYGNTSSASIPILLNELVTTGEVKKGDLILFWGIGAGILSSASVVKIK